MIVRNRSNILSLLYHLSRIWLIYHCTIFQHCLHNPMVQWSGMYSSILNKHKWQRPFSYVGRGIPKFTTELRHFSSPKFESAHVLKQCPRSWAPPSGETSSAFSVSNPVGILWILRDPSSSTQSLLVWETCIPESSLHLQDSYGRLMIFS